MHRPVLYLNDILAWADAFRQRVGRWPNRHDGELPGRDVTWCALDQALQKGHRGLLPGSSLAKLLLEYRGVRHRNLLPSFSLDQILDWADSYHDRTRKWPTDLSGPILDAPGETWRAVDKA